jgi:hypothetical protein
MASPTGQGEKKFGATGGQTMLTTMAGTRVQGASTMSMGSSNNSTYGQALNFKATHHSSPFRESIIRGMVTGVGFLGKPGSSNN